jgi:hypothetical protein
LWNTSSPILRPSARHLLVEIEQLIQTEPERNPFAKRWALLTSRVAAEAKRGGFASPDDRPGASSIEWAPLFWADQLTFPGIRPASVIFPLILRRPVETCKMIEDPMAVVD